MFPTDQGLENIKKGYELRDRVSDVENYAISNVYFRDGLGDYENALQICRQWNQAYPRQALALLNIYQIYYLLDRYEDALGPLREAQQLERTALSYGNLTHTYLSLNRLDEARETIQEARSHKIDLPAYFGYALYVIAFRQNDKAGMAANEAAARRYLRADVYEIMQDVYRGRLSSMRAAVNRKALPVSRVSWCAGILALVGYPEEAKTAAIAAGKMATNRDLQGFVAIDLASAGDIEDAQKLVADLNNRFPDATSVRYSVVPYVRASSALCQGKPQEAIEILSAVQAYEMINNMAAVYLRAQAHLAAHQGAQAAAEFQKMLDHPSPAFFEVYRNILPHLGLARAYALQGNTTKACAAYQNFLTLWKDADPDIPILKQAKAEYDDLLKKEKSLP
jgi:tetratricopeptide (TPR) repeat protein